jgi:hypothetical protein
MKALLLCVVALAACSNAADTVPAAQTIQVIGTQVLPSALVGTRQNESFLIRNTGRADLTITSVTVTQLDGGVIKSAAQGGFDQPHVAVDAGVDSDPLPVKIAGPLGTGFVQFAWGPQTTGEATALLTVKSDDPANPSIVAEIAGCAAPADGGPSNCVCPFDGGCGF